MPESSDNTRDIKRIAYFISPHGFGHAARAAAVMQVVWENDTSIHFDIFTTVPSWFFQDSLSAPFTFHCLQTDIGLVQKTAFHADLNQTIRHLDAFMPFSATLIAEISTTLRNLNCLLVICDIAPIAILVAKEAQISSVLVENFTWDWIYRQYVRTDHRFKRHIDYLHSVFAAADYHIQTEPVRRRNSADLLTAPVSRKAKMPAAQIRERLGLPAGSKMVLVTTGGIPQAYNFIEKLFLRQNINFVMPGAGVEQNIQKNVIILPHHSAFYHPDLVNASDAVVGKMGYSTLAEIYHAGVPFGYVARSNFRESAIMVDFILKQMSGMPVDESGFRNGNWTAQINYLLDLPRMRPGNVNGADQIGGFITNILP
jgi:hypothetical protein